jgi:predicted Zn-dependent peptidase
VRSSALTLILRELRAIRAVNAEEIQAVACHRLSRGRLGIAVVGPTKDAAAIESWLA